MKVKCRNSKYMIKNLHGSGLELDMLEIPVLRPKVPVRPMLFKEK